MNQDLLLSFYLGTAIFSAMLGIGAFWNDKSNTSKVGFVQAAFFVSLCGVLIFTHYNYWINSVGHIRALLAVHACFVAANSSLLALILSLTDECLDQSKILRLFGKIFLYTSYVYVLIIFIVAISPTLHGVVRIFFLNKGVSFFQYAFLFEFFHFTIFLTFSALINKVIVNFDKKEDLRENYSLLMLYLSIDYIFVLVHIILVTLRMLPPLLYFSKLFIYPLMFITLGTVHRKYGLYPKSPREYMNSVIKSMHSGLILYDESYTIVYVNDACCLLLDKTREDLIKTSILSIFPNSPESIFSKEILSHEETLSYDESFKNEVSVILSILPHVSRRGKFIGAACFLEDSTFMVRERTAEIEKRRKLVEDIAQLDIKIRNKEEMLETQKLKKMSLESQIIFYEAYDPLTGLYNQQSIEKEIENFLNNNSKDSLGVFLFDIDDFKTYNDAFGYDFGDALLKAVGEKLKTLENESILASRTDADEFLLIFKNFRDVDEIKSLAEEVQRLLNSIIVEKVDVALTISLGISLYPEHGTRTEVLLANADLAVSNAKSEGKNKYEFYREDYQEQIERDFALIQDLSTSIERDEIKVKFLPVTKIDGENYKIESVDAVVEWYHPKFGRMGREQFDDLAQKSGFISEIDKFILEKISSLLSEYDFDFRINVPLSKKLFYWNYIVDFLQGIFEYSQNYTRKINLMVSESTSMADQKKATEIFATLRGLGFEITIQKFGVQYSALTYLKGLGFDVLRLDKSFVETISSASKISDKDKAIIKAIYSFSKTYGVKIIAEGVMSKLQFEFLSELGYEYFQNYHIQTAIEWAEIFES